MRLEEIKRLAESSADPVFATDSEGLIVAWNQAAVELFNLQEKEVLGCSCEEVIRGTDDCGAVCGENCLVRQATHSRQPLSSFEMQVATPNGRKWCCFSVLRVEENRSTFPYTIHIARLTDARKRLDLLLRDFVRREAALNGAMAEKVLSASHTPARAVALTAREREILSLSAKGITTNLIADQLHISPITVNNHFQHILSKLGAHTRLAAIRRAESAGLI